MNKNKIKSFLRSRRITLEHPLVYQVENNIVNIASALDYYL
ncbi:hypothetical protein ACYSNX_00960 [Myroides sp. LJL115]